MNSTSHLSTPSLAITSVCSNSKYENALVVDRMTGRSVPSPIQAKRLVVVTQESTTIRAPLARSFVRVNAKEGTHVSTLTVSLSVGFIQQGIGLSLVKMDLTVNVGSVSLLTLLISLGSCRILDVRRVSTRRRVDPGWNRWLEGKEEGWAVVLLHLFLLLPRS